MIAKNRSPEVLELPGHKMGLEYRAQEDVCRFTSQNLLNERSKDVITFNPECGQSNVTLSPGKKGKKEQKAGFAIALFT